MYNPIVDITMKEVTNKINSAIDKAVADAIYELKIDVNKEELMKRISEDRRSYDKGYDDGYKEAKTSYDHGHRDGYAKGYQDGYEVGRNGIINSLVDFIDSRRQ